MPKIKAAELANSRLIMSHLIRTYAVSRLFAAFQYDITRTKHFFKFCRCKYCCLPFGTLNLKAPNKNCSRRHFNLFYLYLLKKIRLDFFMCILCIAEDSHEISSLIFSEEIFINVVCCSCDRPFKIIYHK